MTQMTLSQALNRAHHDVMAADDHIIVIGEDIHGGSGVTGGQELGGVFGVTRGLASRFGAGRVIDTPISETAFVGMATGAAMTGLKPIVEVMFCDFMGVCFDQIMNQAAKARFLSNGRFDLPLVIRTTMGAGDGSGAMHSQSTFGMLSTVPGLMVACPSSPADAAGLLKSAVAAKGPTILMEHKGLYGHADTVEDDLPAVPIGKGRVVREGTDLTIIAVSAFVHKAEAAAEALKKDGIEAEVIDPRTIKPLDEALILESVKKTGRLLVASEDAAFAGFADAVISFVTRAGFADLKAAPVAVTPPDMPVPYGRRAEAKWLPTAETIIKAAKKMMEA
ncbi:MULTISPECIES: alpha-ketoacid dehydrogenase subunit beta [Kordiimonas]|jgi:pyruvate dehydrogenase E1 component beta subunit|uniref:alpha-ketoacid dehydrogenase subunit beta n=1 Tax=Kordiimonas TaxID=288021 RepID=UPI00257BFB9C|nr:transketolase C-terminal domain-containing protein [Kordiimonas sp. UBA4487]